METRNEAKLRSVSVEIKYYVTEDELFDILYNTHLSLGHGGRDRMNHQLTQRYKNITLTHIKIFLELCESCHQKKSGCKKGVVVKPMVYNEFNSRGKPDLIDLQLQCDSSYKFILFMKITLLSISHCVLSPLNVKMMLLTTY